jgi:hypothetical protein
LFVLEGRLTGLWAKEFLRVARTANQGHGDVFDLQQVFFVDSEGEAALRWLSGRGAKFITESAYGKDLCHRLKLDRVETRKTDSHRGKWPKASRKIRHRQTRCTTVPDSSTGAHQHPSKCVQ